MKKLLLFLFFLLPGVVASQITITESDMPDAGSVYLITHPVIDFSIDVNETGDNYTWDYSGLIPLTGSTDTFANVSALPVLEQIFFLFSNLVEKGGANLDFNGFTIQDVFTIYKKSSSKFQIDGYAGTLNGVPVPLVYSSSDVLYKFPINFGNEDSSNASFAFSLPGVMYLAQQRHRVNSVDGWGTITTPVGTYSALRIKSVITDLDSVSIDSLGFGSTVNLKSYEYKWLASGSGLPVFQINAQDVLGIPLITNIMYQDTSVFTGISNVSENSSLKIFPNPAGNLVHLSLSRDQPASILIVDALGRKMMEEKTTYPPVDIVVDHWPGGIYFVYTVQNGKSSSSSFSINH